MIPRLSVGIFKRSLIAILLLTFALSACGGAKSAEKIPTQQPEAPRACLTDDSWQAAVSNPTSIPSGLSGRLVAFGRTAEDGKDPNPGNTGMFTINLDGSAKKALGRGLGAEFAPGGAQIVYFSPDANDGLHLVDVISGATSHIPNTSANDYFPRWSPDGKQIAFTRSSDSSLYLINPDGSGLRRVSQGIAYGQGVGWTPDGKSLYYSVGTQTGSEIRKVDIESGEAVKLFEENAFDISPDGSKVVFSDNSNKAYVSNIDGSGRKLLADMEHWSVAVPVIWSPDGKWLIANIRKPSDPDIAGFPIPHALINAEDCRVIPLPWYGDAYDWIP